MSKGHAGKAEPGTECKGRGVAEGQQGVAPRHGALGQVITSTFLGTQVDHFPGNMISSISTHSPRYGLLRALRSGHPTLSVITTGKEC